MCFVCANLAIKILHILKLLCDLKFKISSIAYMMMHSIHIHIIIFIQAIQHKSACIYLIWRHLASSDMHAHTQLVPSIGAILLIVTSYGALQKTGQ